ncbi:hypothetical protein CDAR_508411 [Caerostris darwini]|uniref:Uncharacterized protein n=1 Tax=Caerostris darwini TaxID=1538125 RepID=A0AAV4WT41_9ARAC|nr:hypothetical protein CDAR_508411 [Caerostris darwini]
MLSWLGFGKDAQLVVGLRVRMLSWLGFGRCSAGWASGKDAQLAGLGSKDAQLVVGLQVRMLSWLGFGSKDDQLDLGFK